MRAHHQRRLLWIVNAVLGLALVAVLAWYVLDVRGEVADAARSSPAFAEQAIRDYEQEPPAAQSALRAPVSEAELDEIDQQRFQKNGKRWWWLYSGPVPPEPPEDVVVEEVKKPTVNALEKLGEALFLIYCPAEGGEGIACDSVLSWKFKDGTIQEFKPGEPFQARKNDPWSIRLHDVKRAPGGGYEILYEVFDEFSTDPVEPKGTSQGVESLFWGARAPLPRDIEGRIRITPANPPPGTGEGSASDGEVEAAEGTVGVTETPAAPPETRETAPTPAAEDEDVRATIEWENRNRANVTLDRRAYDYFKGRDADSIAKSIKTQVARDESGRTLGLQVTGLDADSPITKFGFQRGDILVSIDGSPVASRSDAVNVIQGMDENVTRVTVVIDRNGRKITYVIDPRDPDVRRSARYLDNR